MTIIYEPNRVFFNRTELISIRKRVKNRNETAPKFKKKSIPHIPTKGKGNWIYKAL